MRSREPRSSKLSGPDRKQGPQRESQRVETWRAELEPLGETSQQGLVLGARGCHSVRAPVSPPRDRRPLPPEASSLRRKGRHQAGLTQPRVSAVGDCNWGHAAMRALDAPTPALSPALSPALACLCLRPISGYLQVGLSDPSTLPLLTASRVQPSSLPLDKHGQPGFVLGQERTFVEEIYECSRASSQAPPPQLVFTS